MATKWHNNGAKQGLYFAVVSDKGDVIRLAFGPDDADDLAARLNRLEEDAAFGRQCIQDQCENAYVEASVVKHLHDVIRDVHSEHADDLCFMDIDRIFKAAGLSVPDRRVGDKDVMLANCKRFIDVMCQGGKWKSYAELEAEIAANAEQLRLLRKRLADLERELAELKARAR